jgi:hypothetical protein
MKRPLRCRHTAHADEYDNFNFLCQNFYMEMYTYTTDNWLAFHLIIEGYKEGS